MRLIILSYKGFDFPSCTMGSDGSLGQQGIPTIQVVEAVKKYIKGKKSARVITSRKDRFDNALDALAIVEKANPNSAVRIDKMIADINKHRNVDKKINGDTFTTTYGAERAKARAAQQKKKTGTNKKTEVKKVNKTISM